MRGRDSNALKHADADDTQALHELADRAVECLGALDVPGEQAVIGIYRSFGRSSRLAARILRTHLAPMTCHELSPASMRPNARSAAVVSSAVPPEEIHLVVDVSRFGHPHARAIAEDVGVPLVVRPLPALPAWDAKANQVLDRGTEAGKVLASHPAARRPAAIRPLTRRGGSAGPVAASR